MPVLCNYYITLRCNSKCSFCDIWSNPDNKNIPDAGIRTVNHNLAALKKAGVKFIDFTGGEPLLNRELPEMLRAAKKHGMRTSVTTNTILYPKYAENLKGCVDLLHFSLDSLDSDLFYELRGIPGPDKVLESMDAALNLGEKPDVIFTATNRNYKSIEDIYKETSKRKLIILISPFFDYTGEKKLPDDALDYLEEFAKRPYTYMNRSFIKLRRDGGNRTDRPVCKAVSSTIVISPDNKLLLPCFHKSVKAIDINNNLTGLLKSDMVKNFKKNEGRFPFCEGCDINCYFEPSFATSISKYFFAAIPSKIKYGMTKYLFPRKIK